MLTNFSVAICGICLNSDTDVPVLLLIIVIHMCVLSKQKNIFKKSPTSVHTGHTTLQQHW